MDQHLNSCQLGAGLSDCILGPFPVGRPGPGEVHGRLSPLPAPLSNGAFLPLPGFYREPPVSPEGPENAAWATRADTALATQCPVKIPAVCTEEGSALVPGQGVFAGLRPPDCKPPSAFTAVLAKTFPQEVEMPPTPGGLAAS